MITEKVTTDKMITEKTWDEFRQSGLLWWINMVLHTFGWSIICTVVDGKITGACPARVKFRGFDEASNTEGYIKVSEYLNNNSDEICKEAKE